MANVLVIRLSAFGDVAMLVPVVYSVAKQYPGDTFYVLTNKNYEVLFESGLNNLRTIGVYRDSYKNIGGLFRLGNFLRTYGIDSVADVHDVLRSQFLRKYVALFGKKARHIDKGRTEKKQILRHEKPLQPLKHTTERYMDVFSSLGYPAGISYTSYFDYQVTEVSLPPDFPFRESGNLIGVAPFAKHRSKMYPVEKMEQVVKSLSSEATVYVFGSKSEVKEVEDWQTKYGNVIFVAGRLTLKQELLLMSKLKTMVSMDSANMHLASLVGTPVISVWGGTHPYLGFYGFRQLPEDAVLSGLKCSPCSVFGNENCLLKENKFGCMQGIDPETIVRKVKTYFP